MVGFLPHLWIVLAMAVVLGAEIRVSPVRANSDLEAAYQRCQALPEGPLRLACTESAAKSSGSDSPTDVQTIAGWRMVRTPHPQGGKPAVSIMRPAELAGSDPDFAGLMIRCGQSDLEVLPVLMNPLSLHIRPQVVLGAPPEATSLEAAMAPPGAMVLLPAEATKLAKGPWQNLTSLKLAITSDAGTVHGSVPLDGLGAALGALTEACDRR